MLRSQAQGACRAIEDAVTLGEALTACHLRARIEQDVAKLMQDADIRARMDTFAFKPVRWSPDEIVQQANAKGQMYGKLIQRKNIVLE